jgi:hypothetical protein
MEFTDNFTTAPRSLVNHYFDVSTTLVTHYNVLMQSRKQSTCNPSTEMILVPCTVPSVPWIYIRSETYLLTPCRIHTM